MKRIVILSEAKDPRWGRRAKKIVILSEAKDPRWGDMNSSRFHLSEARSERAIMEHEAIIKRVKWWKQH